MCLMALQFLEKLFYEYQYFKSFSRQVTLLKMLSQSLLCSFFFLLKLAQHGWDPLVSRSFLNKQTNCLNFHLYFYFLLFLRFFRDSVIFLKFPEVVSFNRNNIDLLSISFLFSRHFPWIYHCHNQSNLHFFSFLYYLFPFSVAHPLWGSFSSKLSPMIFTFVLVLCEQSVQALHAASGFFLSSSLLSLSNAGTRYLYPMNLRDPKQVRRTCLKGADSSIYYFIK